MTYTEKQASEMVDFVLAKNFARMIRDGEREKYKACADYLNNKGWFIVPLVRDGKAKGVQVHNCQYYFEA